FGSITAIDSLANNTVLVRFKNKSSLYNTLTTLDVNNNLKAYIGSDELFSTPPVDLSNTDLGSAGSQHKFLVKTPYSDIFTDAKRGHVILSTGTEVKNLALHNASAWFANHLPFKIEKVTGKPIDNHYNGIGLTGVYDERYHRLILTKRDYQPKSECIKYE